MVNDELNEVDLSSIFGGSGERSERLKAIQEFYTSKGINLKTDLSNKHIEAIVQIDLINTYLNDTWDINLQLDKATTLFKELRVSKDRKGRKEYVESMKSFIIDTLGEGNKGTLRKVLGL